MPTPAKPRARRPLPDSTTAADFWVAIANSTLALISLGYLGWPVFTHPSAASITAYTLAIAAGIIAARYGLEWRYRVQRYYTRTRVYQEPCRDSPDDPNGFAGQVYLDFDKYFSKYRRDGTEPQEWLNRTAGIRYALYREIIDIYRESRTSAGSVKWIIRYLARDVADVGVSGKLRQIRQRYRVARSTKLWCSSALAVLVPTTMVVFITAVGTTPISSLAAIFVILASGRSAVARWWHIISERRRFIEEQRDYAEAIRRRREEYNRWKEKLDDACPSESEMENWLDCDKTVFLDETLRHYGLKWQSIIAHTFLLTPFSPDDTQVGYRKRARSYDGPWRYSDYDMRLFLVTRDGVREAATHHAFDHAKFHGKERRHFRFDAVSSLYVEAQDDSTYRLTLTLMDGDPRPINVVDERANEPGFAAGEPPPDLAEMNLEMTGFEHTLHILEGIAADGKEWIARDSLVLPDTYSTSTSQEATVSLTGTPTPSTNGCDVEYT